jgi:PAS domain S-box-containing protein
LSRPSRLRKSPVSRKLRILKRAILVFVPAALISLAVIYLLSRAQEGAARSIAVTTQEKLVEIASQRVAALLVSVSSDLRFLAAQQELRHLLADDSPEGRRQLAQEYLAFASHKQVYDQIRFLDAEGREIVRVNRNAGTPSIVPDDALQRKVDLYYVGETLSLGPGEIFVSPLDLYVNDGRIEEPIKPMIRFGTPVFDGEGRKRGLVILYYLAQPLLDRIRTASVAGREQLWLLNADGYWLVGPGPEDEWGFMYPDRQDRSFAARYPEAWETIRSASGVGRVELADGLLTYERVPFASESNVAAPAQPQPLYVLSYVPASAISGRSTAFPRTFDIATLGLMALLASGAWLVARSWTERDLSAELLRRSEARFRGLLESAPDAVVITDDAGRIVLANAQTLQLFGYGRDELIGQPVEMLLPNKYRGGHVAYRTAYAAAPRARPMGAGLELLGQRKDGSEFPVAISLSPSQTEEGMLIFCDIRDVTDQRETERKIKELNARLTRDNSELDALNKELEAFSYSVSHDLRAPLRAIDGFSQALSEDCADQLDASGRGYLERIRGAAQRMGMLIDDLLKLARVTRSEVSIDDVDLAAMARDIARELQAAEPERSVDVEVAEGLRARGDPRLLRIALENLLGNAWKFTSGRDAARIEVGEASGHGAPAFFVRDNGVGFDMAHAARLFGAFQRLHHQSEFAGTGIGLATAQRIVRRHGGQAWAEAEPGRGATFYFTIRAGEKA